MFDPPTLLWPLLVEGSELLHGYGYGDGYGYGYGSGYGYGDGGSRV